MFDAWGVVVGLVGVLGYLEGRLRGRLRGRGWLRGEKARDWRPVKLLVAMLQLCDTGLEMELFNSYLMFVLTLSNCLGSYVPLAERLTVATALCALSNRSRAAIRKRRVQLHEDARVVEQKSTSALM